MFASLYDKVLGWSKHPKAVPYLGGISAAEAIIFPIPVVLMMAPMALARPERAWWLAMFTTLTSVAGGIIGYFVGALLFDSVGQWIIDFYHAQAKFEQLKGWFDEWGIWVVFIAGVSPIPYKLITLTSGLLGLAFLPFVLASIVGRGFQFFLVAAIIRIGGVRFETTLRKWIDWIGWGMLLALIALYFLLKH